MNFSDCCSKYGEEEMKPTLGKKLGLGFGSILALMLASGTASLYRIHEIQDIQDFLLNVRVPTLGAGRSLQREIFLSGNKARQGILAGHQAARAQDAKARFDAAWVNLDKDLATLTQLSPRWTVQANRDQLAAMKQGTVKFRSLQEQALQISSSGTPDAVEKAGNFYADTATPAGDEVAKSVAELVTSYEQLNEKSKDDLESASRSLVWTLSAATLASIGIGVFVAIFLARGISASTSAVLRQAEAIAAGDLTRDDLKVRSHDELGDLTVAVTRAGEAGKGFAVVANEVKELAKETAKATEDISRKIEAIQTDTKGAVEAIASISGVIHQINDISGTIATAVEEQNATTNEMSRNVSEAAQGSGEITSNISGVAQAAASTSQGANDTQKEAQQLVQLSTKLRHLVEQFKIDNESSPGAGVVKTQAKAAHAGS
jgi:methyl-accepting chemotaxis protein